MICATAQAEHYNSSSQEERAPFCPINNKPERKADKLQLNVK
jgi:hypothetical protein